MGSTAVLFLALLPFGSPDPTLADELGPPPVSAREAVLEVVTFVDLGDFAPPLDIPHSIPITNSGNVPLLIDDVRPG